MPPTVRANDLNFIGQVRRTRRLDRLDADLVERSRPHHGVFICSTLQIWYETGSSAPGVRKGSGRYNSGMIRRAILAAVVALCLTITLNAREPGREATKPPAASEDGISVWFSPKGGCTDAIVGRINAARKTIDVQAYSFTSTDRAKAMDEAKDRGVKMRAILDKKASGEQYSGATYLANHGIETYTDGEHPIAHNKVMILDGATVITGSFNFTRQAETSNAENLLIIEGKPKLAAAYAKNFEAHLGHSKPYAR
jgi:phosphatidylserine/phosphatidylglycerophosphate/cardiolipin synthase-like enzyme